MQVALGGPARMADRDLRDRVFGPRSPAAVRSGGGGVPPRGVDGSSHASWGYVGWAGDSGGGGWGGGDGGWGGGDGGCGGGDGGGGC
jgi:hypothetical protein